MSTLALMTGAENLKSQIVALAEEGESHKAFLISHTLGKIADDLKKRYQPDAVKYWQDNKELPAGYTMKELSSGKKYAFDQDPQWQLLRARLDARESILKQSAESHFDIFDHNKEKVPKVSVTEGIRYTFSQK